MVLRFAPVLLAVGILLIPAPVSGQVGDQEEITTYDEVLSGMRCFENAVGDSECDYQVGDSLHFGVAGVGTPDGSIYFYSASFEGDYFAVVGIEHGCIVVRPGLSADLDRRIDLAFVSPRTGNVHRSVDSCAAD